MKKKFSSIVSHFLNYICVVVHVHDIVIKDPVVFLRVNFYIAVHFYHVIVLEFQYTFLSLLIFYLNHLEIFVFVFV